MLVVTDMQDKKTANVKRILETLVEYKNIKNIQELNEFLDLPKNTLYTWIKRNKIVKPLKILGKMPKISEEWLKTGIGSMLIESTQKGLLDKINREPSNISPGPPIQDQVPLISWVQAGDWTEVIDQCRAGEAEDFITMTGAAGKNAFALRVVGNSMEPEFKEGEIVTVDPDREAESGSYVIAKINRDEATFKQLIKDGGRVYLRPINDAYPLMDVTGLDLRIVGRVVARFKSY
ncbi:MAG: S24 family peptidase [Desulfobacula sp.]|jgi:SOS-response transcriptional repressor LexA